MIRTNSVELPGESRISDDSGATIPPVSPASTSCPLCDDPTFPSGDRPNATAERLYPHLRRTHRLTNA